MSRRATASQVSAGAFKQAPISNGGERRSSFLLQCLSRCRLPDSAIALDVACGCGRHLSHLADVATTILGLDLDGVALQSNRKSYPSIHCLQADLANGIPIASSTASLVVAIHPPMLDLMPEFARILLPGGLLIYESFGGRGENWRNLPKAGAVFRAAQEDMRLLRYKESPVGPPGEDAVSFKLFCQRS